MEQAVRVEIVPCTVEADEQTIAERVGAVERLANLGQIDPAVGVVGGTTTTWVARIGGAEFPVLAYGLEGPGDDSRPGDPVLVSLVVPADEVSVVRHRDMARPVQVAPQPPAASPEPKTVQVWGKPGPDPRESIPGWKPEQHDHTLKRWTCGCDPVLLGIQAAAAKTGNIDLRVVQP